MVLRAGEAAGMESEDNPGKLKCSTRRVRPPVWHQDYEMVHPHSSATNVRGQLQGGVNPEALLPSENTDVKSLTEEVKQMKSMLMNLGEMMKNMQDQKYVDPLAAARQSPQAPHGPLPAPSIRVTASATNPLVMPACGSRYLSQCPALVDPGRHLEDLMKHLRIVCILPIGFILRQLLTPVFQPSQQFLYPIYQCPLFSSEARHLALAYAHHPQPYTTSLQALRKRYGQPQHLVLREITSVQSLPNVRSGDSRGFSQFAVRIRALVGMLQTWGHGEGARELACASHVHQLLSKLPPDQVASFARQTRLLRPDVPYNLIDFANWLEEEAECQSLAVQVSEPSRRITGPLARDHSTATFFQGVSQEGSARDHIQNQSTNPRVKFSSESALPSCAFCDSQAHHLSRCPGFREFDAAAKEKWITDNGRCWRCGRSHRSSNCNLKKGCPQCKGRHLGILHEVNTRKSEQQILYLRRPSGLNSVLLKVVRVVLTHNGKSLETYAILDDGSERTMLLSSAAEGLGLNGAAETLILRTIRQGTEKIVGATVSFSISSASQHQKKYEIKDAFTAKQLALPEQTYPITTLQRRYQHLQGLPMQEFHKIRPLLLVGADHSHLLCSTECVRFGPPGSPVALHTCLEWTLHGPTSLVQESSSDTRCLLTSLDKDQLQRDVERLWQINIFPYSKNSKAVIRSKQDQQAFECLEQQTERHEINGIERYATPLLRVKNSPLLHEPPAKPAVEHAKPAVRPSDELPKPSDELPEPPAVKPVKRPVKPAVRPSDELSEPSELSEPFDKLPEPPAAEPAKPPVKPPVKPAAEPLKPAVRPSDELSELFDELPEPSKPLGYVSLNISDTDSITPNILLMGRRDTSLLQVMYVDSELLTHRKWRHSQILAGFWVRFIKDYLPSLQSRQKWKADGPSISTSVVVILMDPQLPCSSWPIGTVSKVLPSSDGCIRVAGIVINVK
ncbi:hypothetical protein F2P79_022979 [Pimephales promelas]|nr:hypothetical protein F2P79_022979 [Pimephales promelas]